MFEKVFIFANWILQSLHLFWYVSELMYCSASTCSALALALVRRPAGRTCLCSPSVSSSPSGTCVFCMLILFFLYGVFSLSRAQRGRMTCVRWEGLNSISSHGWTDRAADGDRTADNRRKTSAHVRISRRDAVGVQVREGEGLEGKVDGKKLFIHWWSKCTRRAEQLWRLSTPGQREVHFVRGGVWVRARVRACMCACVIRK